MMIFWLEDEDYDDNDDAKMHWAPRSSVVAWWCAHFDLLLSQLAKILWQLFMIAILCYYSISVCKSMSRIWGYPAIIETKFKTGLYFFLSLTTNTNCDNIKKCFVLFNLKVKGCRICFNSIYYFPLSALIKRNEEGILGLYNVVKKGLKEKISIL